MVCFVLCALVGWFVLFAFCCGKGSEVLAEFIRF